MPNHDGNELVIELPGDIETGLRVRFEGDEQAVYDFVREAIIEMLEREAARENASTQGYAGSKTDRSEGK